MNNQVFVPVTDDIIYNHPECIEGPLVPYAAGMECHDWLSIEINPEEPELSSSLTSARLSKTVAGASKLNNQGRNIRLAYSA